MGFLEVQTLAGFVDFRCAIKIDEVVEDLKLTTLLTTYHINHILLFLSDVHYCCGLLLYLFVPARRKIWLIVCFIWRLEVSPDFAADGVTT
jgi:hypothetical protein